MRARCHLDHRRPVEVPAPPLQVVIRVGRDQPNGGGSAQRGRADHQPHGDVAVARHDRLGCIFRCDRDRHRRGTVLPAARQAGTGGLVRLGRRRLPLRRGVRHGPHRTDVPPAGRPVRCASTSSSASWCGPRPTRPTPGPVWVPNPPPPAAASSARRGRCSCGLPSGSSKPSSGSSPSTAARVPSRINSQTRPTASLVGMPTF